ncbi:hypothetical protein [Halorubrum ezzemoulense]|uniref:hypothetical protein n=1 Tax=Halorubrum ezzemoulense TaxID=337243 RepID=UPI00117BD2E1|nr:hypothetical protein [Halorubrum ezzemoulense]
MNPRKLLVMKTLEENDRHKIDGRTRLQKLVFLAQKEASADLPSTYTYIPYDYGPFSASLLDEVEELDGEGYLTEKRVSGARGKKYVYELTEEGKERLREELEELDEADRKAIEESANFAEGMFSDTPISRLLEHVYNNYPEYAKNSVLK